MSDGKTLYGEVHRRLVRKLAAEVLHDGAICSDADRSRHAEIALDRLASVLAEAAVRLYLGKDWPKTDTA